jgi:hypothetical protein
LKRPNIIRVFAIYMVLLYLWFFYLEPKIMLHTELTARVFLFKWGLGTHNIWYYLFIAPSFLYILSAFIIATLIFRPDLIEVKRYAKLLAYALAPFATAWTSSSLLLPQDDELREYIFSEKGYLLWFGIGYPLAYTIYSHLIIKIFNPLMKNVNLSEVMPKFYRASTKAARILGLPLLAFSVICVFFLLGRMLPGLFATLIFPSLGIYLAGYKLKDRPYRFLIAFPLFGQAVFWRMFLFDLGIFLHLAMDDLITRSARVIALLSLIRWSLFPIPGFGGAFASLALANFLLVYKLNNLYYVIASLPIPLTSLWLFGEWLMFYKALNRALK